MKTPGAGCLASLRAPGRPAQRRLEPPSKVQLEEPAVFTNSQAMLILPGQGPQEGNPVTGRLALWAKEELRAVGVGLSSHWSLERQGMGVFMLHAYPFHQLLYVGQKSPKVMAHVWSSGRINLDRPDRGNRDGQCLVNFFPHSFPPGRRPQNSYHWAHQSTLLAIGIFCLGYKSAS